MQRYANPASRVYGVNGFWSSLGSGLSNFASSGLGQALLTVGTTLGTAALSKELFGNNQAPMQSNQPTQGQYMPPATQPNYVNPAYAPMNPATGANIYPSLSPNTPVQPANVNATAPTWLIPAALAGVALIIILRNRK